MKIMVSLTVPDGNVTPPARFDVWPPHTRACSAAFAPGEDGEYGEKVKRSQGVDQKDSESIDSISGYRYIIRPIRFN